MIWAKEIPVSRRYLRMPCVSDSIFCGCDSGPSPVTGEWTCMDMDDWHPVVDLGILGEAALLE